MFSVINKRGDSRAELYKKHVAGKMIVLSFITVGELLFWSKTKNWGPQKIADMEKRIALTTVIPYDIALCEKYAELKARNKKVGSPVPENDLWIAATAVRHSIPLISHNRRNFDDIPDLVLISEAPPILKAQINIPETGA